MSDDECRLGRKLKICRAEKGWSQADLARELSLVKGQEVSRESVSQWEAGRGYPRERNITALSKVFGLPEYEFQRFAPPAEVDSECDAGVSAAIQVAGTARALAEALGITEQAVGQWSRIPPERCLDVERITGVSRHILRPNIYGEPVAVNGAGVAAHDTPASRLRAARRKHFEHASEAARANGWAVPTFVSHENGIRGFGRDEAIAYGRAFGVAPAHLLMLPGGVEPAHAANGAAPVLNLEAELHALGDLIAACRLVRAGDATVTELMDAMPKQLAALRRKLENGN
ncbi:MAG: helix-turn-helix domain-containing protein [Hyphomicrobiaceae bacterium]|nr:helix-turn-helix domain-containing protein [Hyphomicrobiaceae bacterium]